MPGAAVTPQGILAARARTCGTERVPGNLTFPWDATAGISCGDLPSEGGQGAALKGVIPILASSREFCWDSGALIPWGWSATPWSFSVRIQHFKC